MEKDLFTHFHLWIANVVLTIAAGLSQSVILATISAGVGMVSIMYTLYKWYWAKKFNEINMEIKEQELKHLKNKQS